MPRKNKQHSKQFKLDAVNYRKEHPDLTQVECAKNLGIGTSTLARWEAQFKDNDGDIPARGSGNYESDEAKEIARICAVYTPPYRDGRCNPPPDRGFKTFETRHTVL